MGATLFPWHLILKQEAHKKGNRMRESKILHFQQLHSAFLKQMPSNSYSMGNAGKVPYQIKKKKK